MELVMLCSLASLVLSVFALLVAVGSAMRVRVLEQGAAVGAGLSPGSRIDADALMPFVGAAEADAWLRGPTLVVIAKNTCPGCRELITSMNQQSSQLSAFRLLVIERGHVSDDSLHRDAQFNALWVRDAADRSKEIFRTNVSPHAFLIERARVVNQHSGSDAIAHLLGHEKSDQPKAVASTA